MANSKNGLLAKELRNMRIFVPLGGAEISCQDPDGVVRWVVGLEPGKHYADEYVACMARADRLEVRGAYLVKPGGLGGLGRMKPMNFGKKAFESGANADWVAPERTLQQREDAMVRRMQKRMETDMLKRERAMLKRVAERQEREALVEKENTDAETPKETDQQKSEKPKAKTKGGDETGAGLQVSGEKQEVKTDE